MNSQIKKVLPRNVGIFGTVGSGKTNSAQVLIEEASRAGYAVIVLDVPWSIKRRTGARH